MAVPMQYVKIGDGTTAWSALPYVAGFPGVTGPTGPSGPTGINGVSGGLVLFLNTNSAAYTGTTIQGTLDTTPTTSAQTNITFQGNSQDTDLIIGYFSVTTPTTTIVAGLWDLNFFASATITTGQYVNVWFDVGYERSSVFYPIVSGSNSASTQITSSTIQQYTDSIYVPLTTLQLTDKVVIRVRALL
jgi:hypothetical protein